MKTRKYKDFLLVAACMLCLAGCNKDEDFNRVTLNYDLEVPQGMKSHIDGYTIVFDSDDTIKINNERVALSSGRLEVEENDNGYWAVFPDTAIMNGATMKGAVQIPVMQNYELVDGTQRLNGPMAAHLANYKGTLYFKNLYSVFKAVISTDAYAVDIYKIKVTALNEGEGLAGTVKFDLTQPTTSNPNSVSITEFTDLQPSVQLDFASPVTIPAYSDKDFHLLVVPFEDLDLMVEVFATKNGEAVKYTYKPTTTKTLNRSCVGKLPVNLQMVDIDPWKELYGDFSITPTRKIRIASSNLQYNLFTHAWRFAEHPYDVLEQTGDAIGDDYATYKQNNTNDGWMGLFGWGTSGWQDTPCREAYLPNATITKGYNNGNEPYFLCGSPYNTMINSCANADWGMYNNIYNPATGNTDPAGTWRTLTPDEWDYLLIYRGRLFHYKQWCADLVSVNISGVGEVKGIVIYPNGIMSKPAGISAALDGSIRTDDLELEHDGDIEDYYDWYWTDFDIFEDDIVTLTEHEYDILMDEGCAFLPAAGVRLRHYYLNANYHGDSFWEDQPDRADSVASVNEAFYYWSSVIDGSHNVFNAYSGLQSYDVDYGGVVGSENPRCLGGAVRLVQDVESTTSKHNVKTPTSKRNVKMPTSKHIKRRKH
ncbi:MAG: hypothetical protein KBT45_07365 [Bacteroidales bacterium]|nr:hypothetical protein [Candidatus Colimorpha pelethequi]